MRWGREGEAALEAGSVTRAEKKAGLWSQWVLRRSPGWRSAQCTSFSSAPSPDTQRRFLAWGTSVPGCPFSLTDPNFSAKTFDQSLLASNPKSLPALAPDNPDLLWAPAPRLQPVQNQAGFFFSFPLEIGFGVSPALSPPPRNSSPLFFLLLLLPETWPGQWLLEEEQVWEKGEEIGAK